MTSTKLGFFRLLNAAKKKFVCVLAVFVKLSTRRGAWAWFHDVWTCGAKVLEY
jgi:hypothetical protein